MDPNSPNSPIWYREPRTHAKTSIRVLLSRRGLLTAGFETLVFQTAPEYDAHFHFITAYRLPSEQIPESDLGPDDVIMDLAYDADSITGVFMYERHTANATWTQGRWVTPRDGEQQLLSAYHWDDTLSQHEGQTASQVWKIE